MTTNLNHGFHKPLLAASITAASFLTGCQLSLSSVSIATILGPPHIDGTAALSQFRTVFARGFYLCPTSAIFSGLCCFVNAGLITMNHYSSNGVLILSGRAPRLLVAGGLMIGIVPYTLALIVPLEEQLLSLESRVRRGEQADVRNEDVVDKLETWRWLNYGRTLLPALGVAMAWTLW